MIKGIYTKMLTGPLEPLFEDGVLSRGDHLCYSPDGELHCLPLHYLEFLGKPLVHFFSVSRVQGAHSLVELLRERPKAPVRFVSVEVPAKQDYADKRADLCRPGEFLEAILPEAGFRYRNFEVSGLRAVDFANPVVHFATHGVFTERRMDSRGLNPFRSSGLVLASEGKEPDLNDVAKGRGHDSNLLSPAKLLDFGIDFSGSHDVPPMFVPPPMTVPQAQVG